MGCFRHPTDVPMTKKRTSAKRETRQSVQQSSAYHRLNALLHTMRRIAQYEDALCELSHQLKGASALPAEADEELRDILEKIPSHDYLVDLESMRAILPIPLNRSSSKEATKTTRVHSRSVAAKKKSGRKSSK